MFIFHYKLKKSLTDCGKIKSVCDSFNCKYDVSLSQEWLSILVFLTKKNLRKNFTLQF